MHKVIACVDGDGHFHVVHPSDRIETIRVLKQIEDGDFWANEISHTDSELLHLDDEEWMTLLQSLEQRGRMELVEYKFL